MGATDQGGQDSRPEEKGAEMTAATAEAQAPPATDDPLVQFGGRIPASLRRRVKVVAAYQGIDGQTILRRALEEYVERHGPSGLI
ncbi:hypothetical protein [Microbispora sp. CA-102843]|uniref:hypothetical protein n=1 Tax=Microbispora sp. CA-102843 TaxID=3239952 RepID=UPI003D949FC5